MLAFGILGLALERILFQPLGANDPEALSEFQLDGAHCCDPSEEAELLSAVNLTLGDEVFAQPVRSLGKAAVTKVKKSGPAGWQKSGNPRLKQLERLQMKESQDVDFAKYRCFDQCFKKEKIAYSMWLTIKHPVVNQWFGQPITDKRE